jgi:hypothetical protein
MTMLGLSKYEIENKIKFHFFGKTVTRQNKDLEKIAELIAEGVANAIDENNKKITEQLRAINLKVDDS